MFATQLPACCMLTRNNKYSKEKLLSPTGVPAAPKKILECITYACGALKFSCCTCSQKNTLLIELKINVQIFITVYNYLLKFYSLKH